MAATASSPFHEGRALRRARQPRNGSRWWWTRPGRTGPVPRGSPAPRLPAIGCRVGGVAVHAAVPLRVVPGEDRLAYPIGADSPHLQALAMHHDPSGAAVQAQSPRLGTKESVQDSFPSACRAPPLGHLLASPFGSRNLVDPIQARHPRATARPFREAVRRPAGARTRTLITVPCATPRVFGRRSVLGYIERRLHPGAERLARASPISTGHKRHS